MIVYLNGRFVPEEQACVSIHDRGFLYGDGIFETIRIYDGTPFLWREHLDRFHAGCRCLRIAPPLGDSEMLECVAELLRVNSLSNAMTRIALARGVGPRGYSPRSANHPTLCVALFPSTSRPASYKVVTASMCLPGESMERFTRSGGTVRGTIGQRVIGPRYTAQL